MKKVFMGCVLMLLSSCSLDTENFEDRFVSVEEQTENTQELQGFVEPIPLNFASRATHSLVNADGLEFTQLYSLKLDLSAFESKEEMQEVKLQGEFKTVFAKQLFEVHSVEFIANDTVVDNEDIVWKNFQEQMGRISFSYPEIWNVSTLRTIIYLYNKNNQPILKIVGLVNPKQINLPSFVSDEYVSVTVNNQTALRVDKLSEDPTQKQFDLYFEGDQEVLKFSVSYNANSEEAMVLQVLNSIKVAKEVTDLQKCGGEENIVCEQGFRCELRRANSGVCVPIK